MNRRMVESTRKQIRAPSGGKHLKRISEEREGSARTIIMSMDSLLQFFDLPTTKSRSLSRAIVKDAIEAYLGEASDVSITEDNVSITINNFGRNGELNGVNVVLTYPFTMSFINEISKLLLYADLNYEQVETLKAWAKMKTMDGGKLSDP